MGKISGLLGRGIRYVRTYGAAQLYRKVRERQLQNQLERPYSRWLDSQQPQEKELEAQRKQRFKKEPVISILVPAYETPPEFLCQMVESLQAQTYEKWELCLADGSRSCQVEETIAPYLKEDGRIRYEHLSENLGISENTNAALSMASGDYVGLLDHDDILFPQTLYEVVKAMEAHPGAEAFYTDEDKVSFDLQQHFQPHFKPDFNPELLQSNNYICHFFVVERKIAKEVGGFRPEFDGAQDYDFIFRCTEQAEQVVHIPQILYSWRSHASSTATNPESKLYAFEAGRRAAEAHLKRQKERANVENTSNYGFYRVRYELLLEGKKTGKLPENEVLIKSFENWNGQTGIKVVYYDKACNKIVTFPQKDVTDDYVLFTRVKKGRLEKEFFRELISLCQRPRVGIACARVYDSHGRLSHEVEMEGVQNPFGQTCQGLKKGYLGYFHRVCLQQEIKAVTDCFLMRGELFEELLRLYQEEVCKSPEPGKEISLDLGWMAGQVKRMGYQIVYDPWAVLYEKN